MSPPPTRPELLLSLPLFRGVPEDALRELSQTLSTATFAPHRNLFTVDRSADAVYVIKSGTVKVHIEEADGREVVVAILGPGEMVGEVSLLDGRQPSATVTTLDFTECLAMNSAVFREAIRTVPMLAFNFARLMASRLRLSNEQIQALAALNVEHRVARQIMAFANRYGVTQAGGSIHIPIRLTQSDLANIIGTSREQTNRVLVSYRKRGLISVDVNLRITIKKPEILARLSVG